MADPNKNRYRKLYAEEFAQARKLLVERYGGTLEWVSHDYQAFQFKAPGVSLVFYPHRSAGTNYNLRVRDQGSTNKEGAQALMAVLAFDCGSCCTFHQKNQWPQFWFQPKQQDKLRKVAAGVFKVAAQSS